MSSIHFCKTDSLWSDKAATNTSVSYFGPSEHERHLELSHSRQTEFAISRLLLRSALSHNTASSLADWELKERPNNTPAVLNQNWQGHISISHSKNYVACAISHETIGIDVEEPRYTSQLEKMAARVFTLEQQNRLQNSNDRDSLFLQLWTEKEALFKAHSSASLPIQFISTEPLKDIGFHTSNICTRRLFGAVASSLPFDQFTVFFWRSPQQVRQIFVEPNT